MLFIFVKPILVRNDSVPVVQRQFWSVKFEGVGGLSDLHNFDVERTIRRGADRGRPWLFRLRPLTRAVTFSRDSI